MAGGSNTSLIFNSKYYKIGGSLIVLMAAMAFSLNVWLIPLFGLEGSALATAITIIVYAFLRYVIIYRGFNLQPYDKTMLKILILVLSGVVLNFLLPHTSSPVLNIFYRSLIIMSVYIGGTYFLKIVPEFHKFIPFRKK
jgi:O-antigen/teichoic acid export membrane protein